jgi:hypothetical protein
MIYAGIGKTFPSRASSFMITKDFEFLVRLSRAPKFHLCLVLVP